MLLVRVVPEIYLLVHCIGVSVLTPWKKLWHRHHMELRIGLAIMAGCLLVGFFFIFFIFIFVSTLFSPTLHNGVKIWNLYVFILSIIHLHRGTPLNIRIHIRTIGAAVLVSCMLGRCTPIAICSLLIQIQATFQFFRFYLISPSNTTCQCEA